MKNKILEHYKKNRPLYIVFSIIFIFLLAGTIYMSGSHESMKEAQNILKTEQNIYLEENDWYLAEPDKNKTNTGIIIYPGARVEPESYLLLAKKISELGFKTFVVPMPFNLAILDTDLAIKVIREYSSIENWFIAGHSLGGSMAAEFAELYSHNLKGLIFLASYPSERTTIKELPVLSITASNDKILDKEKFQNRKSNLPSNTEFVTISGGNHSQFGWYGFQEGDGKATITRDKQLKLIVDHIEKFTYDILNKN